MSCDAICRVSINHVWVSIRFHHSFKQWQQITLPQHEGIMAASFNWTKEMGYNPIRCHHRLEFQTVYPLVATIHDSLLANGPCSWACSTIDESPNLFKGCTLSVYCIMSKAMLSSGSVLPKIGTRSHHLFGYDRRRSNIISDSMPVNTDP